MKPKTLAADEIIGIMDKAEIFLSSVPALMELEEPTTVVGDLHGNWGIYNTILEKTQGQLLFLGDTVDRGCCSIEVFTSILQQMIRGEACLIRGNHETREVNSKWGFKAEMVEKYGSQGNCLWGRVNEVMDLLPVAATIQNKYLAVHGGIGPSISTLEDVKMLEKEMCQEPSPGLMEILWNDPGPEEQTKPYVFNTYRRRCHMFSPGAAEKFCMDNGIDAIVRGHQCVPRGWAWNSNHRVLTIFPLPDYEGRKNKAAICHIEGGEIRVEEIF